MTRHIVAIAGPIASGKTTLAELLRLADPPHSAHLETSSVVIDIANQFNHALAEQESHAPTTQPAVIKVTNQVLDRLLFSISRMAARPLKAAELSIATSTVVADPLSYTKLFQYFEALAVQPDMRDTSITTANKTHYRPLLQWLGGYILQRVDALLWYRELFRRIEELSAEVDLVALTAPRQPAEAEYVQAQGGKIVLLRRPGIATDTNEVTERRILEIKADCQLDNNGSLEQLQRCAGQLRADFLHGQLAAQYRASDY